jgi:hypothetical protein
MNSSQRLINFSEKDGPTINIITSLHLASQKPINLSQKDRTATNVITLPPVASEKLINFSQKDCPPASEKPIHFSQKDRPACDLITLPRLYSEKHTHSHENQFSSDQYHQFLTESIGLSSRFRRAHEKVGMGTREG